MTTNSPALVPPESHLHGFNAARQDILRELRGRVVARCIASKIPVEYILNEAAFHEIRRWESSSSKFANREIAAWQKFAATLSKMSEGQLTAALAGKIQEYGQDIIGSFDPNVYRFVRKVLPPALSLLLSPLRSVKEGLAALGEFSGRVLVHGPVAELQSLARVGTLVVAPTHSSNMDSIAIGLGLLKAGLPPMTYGAGKNLFSNPFISYFMRNLGAYRVDRRLRFRLYKEVLKQYSTILLERGYHSLFFPGGTRSRSNAIERKLKLGLLGTAVEAQSQLVCTHNKDRPLIVIPATINYRLVLEAETLVDDFLAEAGKSRYIIEDDEFSRIGRIVEFLRKIVVHEGSVVVRFGRPLDVYGNNVFWEEKLGQAVSRDRRGRSVRRHSFVVGADATPRLDGQRDSEYTRLLARRLTGAYASNCVFHDTALLAKVVYEVVVSGLAEKDIYRLIRMPKGWGRVSLEKVVHELDRLREWLQKNEQTSGYVLYPSRDSISMIASAVEAFSSYHTTLVIRRSQQHLVIDNWKLVYYYRNRLAHISWLPKEAVCP